jgi:hypothetical protein
MWTTLALAAALSLAPGESGELSLANVRTTHGVLGAARPENKFLPGDTFVLSFDVQGLKVDGDGNFFYSIAMEATDRDGKVLFTQAPRERQATNTLGGDSLPAFASLQIGLEQQPGSYTLKVTVTDLAAKTSRTLSRPYEVLPKAFGLVRPTLTSDPDGRYPAPFVAGGQSLWINFAAVGFGRDREKGHPNLSVSMRVLDEDGRPTTAKPMVGTVNPDEVAAKALAVPMQFLLAANRAGKFTVELTAKDGVSGGTARLSLPLTVLKSK